MKTKLLVVDDHEPFRAFICGLLAGERIDIAGVAHDGASAIKAVSSLHPDVVLLDVNLPDIDGFEVAERLALRPSPPLVVLTSTRDASDFGGRLRRAPVAGFVPKHELSADAILNLVSEPCD